MISMALHPNRQTEYIISDVIYRKIVTLKMDMCKYVFDFRAILTISNIGR